MRAIYQNLVSNPLKKLAVLIDPDKESLHTIEDKLRSIHNSEATHIFIGGSTDPNCRTEELVRELKKHTQLPLIIFPGDVDQISDEADGILFLSLISGRNPEYLIEKQVQAVPRLMDTPLEVIPTGYVLIDSGSETAVERVSGTKPLSADDVPKVVHTAKAGELLGMKLIYLETGSGANRPVPTELIRAVKAQLNIPLIVGGGIRSHEQLFEVQNAGADLVVVGTAFENDQHFFENQNQELNLKPEKHGSFHRVDPDTLKG